MVYSIQLRSQPCLGTALYLTNMDNLHQSAEATTVLVVTLHGQRLNQRNITTNSCHKSNRTEKCDGGI